MKLNKPGIGLLVVLLSLLFLSGCVSSRAPVESLSDVSPDEVIVVGRIELTPRLELLDQQLDNIGSEHLRNMLYVVTDEKWREKTGLMSSGDEYFETKLGENFYIKGSNKPFYFLEGIFYTRAVRNLLEYATLPGGLKVELQPKDKAVYVGTIRYTRNEYFDITKAEIVDDYDRTNAAFKKKFGAKYNLRKALVVPIPIKPKSNS